MIIRNGTVFCEDGQFRICDIRVGNGKIAEIGNAIAAAEEEIDAAGCYVLPGMIDMHFHGCMGDDFCDGTPEAMERMARYEASIGVTSICPATMTLSLKELTRILKTAAEYQKRQKHGDGGMAAVSGQAKQATIGGASLVGINMEGPFISPVKKGAQDAQYILPCNTEIAESFLSASDGLVKVIGIAPEEGDAEPFIRELSKKAVVAIAHSNADYETAKAAFAAGASHAVHLYNAMSEFTHRHPGIVGAAAENENVTAELICDGIHIHPAVVRATFRMFGAGRMIMISDSMRATGLADGRYTLGGQDVDVRGSRAVLAGTDALAGSVTSLPDCVRTAVTEMGIPFESAILASSANPAKKLSIYDRCGSVSVGKAADLVIWNKDYALKKVILRGRFFL